MRSRLNRLPSLRLRDYAAAAVAKVRTKAAPSPPGVYYYGYARQALYDALRLCGLTPGDTVLYPSFICDVTMEPVHRLGLQVAFYPLSDDLLPDWRDLRRRIVSSNAKAVMSVNFFGFAQPMDQWRQLTQETCVAWINDNAHGYGSRHEGTPLEDFGDVSITSMRKVLPLINGASLQDNRAAGRSPADDLNPVKRDGRLLHPEEWRRIGRSAAAVFGTDQRVPPISPRYTTMPAPSEYDSRSSAMESLSRFVLARCAHRLREWRRRRRRLYDTWHRYCAAAHLSPVFAALPPGISPMAYPCYARDFDHRQKWLTWAASNNIDAYPWPSLPENCRQNGAGAANRWRRMLCFPIHPFMTSKDIISRWS